MEWYLFWDFVYQNLVWICVAGLLIAYAYSEDK